MNSESRRLKKDKDGNAFFPSSLEIWLDSYWNRHIDSLQIGEIGEHAKKDMSG